MFFIASKAPLFSSFGVRTKMAVMVNSRMGFIVLILTTSLLAPVISACNPEISITREPQLKEGDAAPLFANKLLRHGNYRSVLRGGSTAIFMLAYGIYFYYRVNKEISFPNLIYFLVYNASLCCIFFLALGAVGLYASSFAFLAYGHLFLLKSN